MCVKGNILMSDFLFSDFETSVLFSCFVPLDIFSHTTKIGLTTYM